MGGLSIWHWLIVLVIVLAIFGTKKLGNIGSDLGKAVRDFKKGLSGEDDKDDDQKNGQASEKLKADTPSEEAKHESEKSSHDASGH